MTQRFFLQIHYMDKRVFSGSKDEYICPYATCRKPILNTPRYVTKTRHHKLRPVVSTPTPQQRGMYEGIEYSLNFNWLFLLVMSTISGLSSFLCNVYIHYSLTNLLLYCS